MTSKWSGGNSDGNTLGVLRSVSLIASLAGGIGSVGFMLYVGRRNRSAILLVLFTIWVLSPFVGVMLASAVGKSWPMLTRVTLYSLMLVLALGSLIVYAAVALGPPIEKPASVFLMVPLVSWLLAGVVVALTIFISGPKPACRGDG